MVLNCKSVLLLPEGSVDIEKLGGPNRDRTDDL